MRTRPIIVAGGAGYIGSHFCDVAAECGFAPIVVDSIGPCTEHVAHAAAGLGEVHEPETHLIPRALAAALTVNGDDYPTSDGTCVRDYVHVLDLAEAHGAGIEYLLDGGASDAINLGAARTTASCRSSPPSSG